MPSECFFLAVAVGQETRLCTCVCVGGQFALFCVKCEHLLRPCLVFTFWSSECRESVWFYGACALKRNFALLGVGDIRELIAVGWPSIRYNSGSERRVY